jgi:hypothetical protein
LVYSPPFERWALECIDCPKIFYWMSDRSLRLDGTGHAHLAYGGDALYYAWFDGVAWQYEVVDSTSSAGEGAALALDSSGYPHIAYYVSYYHQVRFAFKDAYGWHVQVVDNTGQAERFIALALDPNQRAQIAYYGNMALQVAKQNDGGWQITTVDNEMWVGQYPSMATDAAGYAHISYYNAGSAAGGLRYAFEDSTGWHIQNVEETVGIGTYTSLSLGGDGYAHISYYDDIDYALKYAHQDSQGWHVEVVDDEGDVGRHSSLALDHLGQARISYLDAGNGRLKYAVRVAGGWNSSTIETDLENNSFTSLALDGNDLPQVAYTSHGELKVLMQDGNGWDQQSVDRNGYAGENNRLLLDASGNPRVAYWDRFQNVTKLATHGVGGWQAQVVEGVGIPFDMVLDAGGYPHFCHYQGGGYGAYYTYQDATGWHTETVDISGSGSACSLALDRQGEPHLVYFRLRFHDEGWIYTYHDAQGWHSSYVNYYGAMILALDHQDKPYILVAGSELLLLFPQQGGGWQPSLIESSYTAYAALALGADGNPRISYYGMGDGDLKYAAWDGNAWQVETLDSQGDPGRYTDIAIDEYGFTHISYHDQTYPYTGNLKYAYQDERGWRIQTVDPTYDSGYYTSIALDRFGEPLISYHNAATGDLYLVYPFKLTYLPLTLQGPMRAERLALHLDEAQGATTFADASGFAYHGACTGTACPQAGAAGALGTAVSFDGIDDAITLGNPPRLNFSGQVTLEAWVKVGSTSGIQDIIAHGYTLEPQRELYLRINDGNYQVGSWDGVGYNTSAPIPAEDVGAWVHLAGLYDGTHWRLYRNGVEASAALQPYGAVLVEASWAIGAAGSGQERFFDGYLDEVAVYSRALSMAEIWQHYQAGLGR